MTEKEKREKERKKFIEIAQNLGWDVKFVWDSLINGYYGEFNLKSPTGRELQMRGMSAHFEHIVSQELNYCYLVFGSWLRWYDDTRILQCIEDERRKNDHTGLFHRIVNVHCGEEVSISEDIKFFRSSLLELETEYSKAIYKIREKKENSMELLFFLFAIPAVALFLFLGLYF